MSLEIVFSVGPLTYSNQNIGQRLEGFILDASLAVDHTSVANHMTREHKASFAVPEHVLSISYQFLHRIFLVKLNTRYTKYFTARPPS